MERGSVLAMMMEMASGPEGVSSAQLQARLRRGNECCGPLLSAACKRGHLHASRRPGARIRWFDTPERAAEWASLPAMAPSEWCWNEADRKVRTNYAKRVAAHKAQPMPKRAMPAPVHVKELWTKPAGDDVDYSRAKVTVCPSPGYGSAGRIGVAAGQLGSFGAGFSAVGIGRDVQTGKSWG